MSPDGTKARGTMEEKTASNMEEKTRVRTWKNGHAGNVEGEVCTNVEEGAHMNVGEKACTNVEERRFSAAPSLTKDSGFSPRGRTFYQGTFAAIALLALASISAQAQNPTADLPPGAMQAKATTACVECHEARIILQQRLAKPAWGKEVDKMTKWGAVVDPADRDALIDYLSTNFSPDKPPYDPPRTASDKNNSAKAK
jgi:mono/diheme cytochrome c family protein